MTDTFLKLRSFKVLSIPFKIATGYFLFGVIWILISDKVLGLLVRDAAVLTGMSVLNECCFVLVTASLLYVLIGRYISRIDHWGKEASLTSAKYRELVESANSIIIRMDNQGNITFFNEFAQDFFGYSKDDILGRNVVGTIVPELDSSGRDMKEMIEDIVKNPERYTKNQNENMRAGGERVWIAWTNKPIRAENGQINEVLCVGNDISERKLAEEELRQSNAFLDRIIEDAPHAMWISDSKGNLIRLNNALRELLRITDDDVVGKYNILRDNIVEEHGCMPLIKEVFENGRTVKFILDYDSSLLGQLDLAESAHVSLDITISPVLNANGAVTNAIIQEVDITERKRAEKALRESQAMLQLAQTNANIGFWDYDPRTGEHKRTPELNRLYGTDSETISTYQDWRQRVHSDDIDRFEAERDALLARREPFDLEFRFHHSSGQVRWMSVRGLGIHDDRGDLVRVIGVNIDITARKKMEEALRNSERDLRHAQSVAQTGSWRLDMSTNALLWSEETYRMFGVRKGTALTYESFLALVHPEDRDYVHNKWSAALQGERYDIEHRIIVGDKVVWVRERAELEFDEKGTLQGGFGTVQDITGRKRMEEDLRKSRDELELRVRERTAALQKANEELRRFPSMLISAQEEERKRLGTELHDSIGQTIVAVKLWVEAALLAKDEGHLEDALEKLQQVAPSLGNVIKEIRVIYTGLRPTMLDNLGLISTLQWFCREFQNLHPNCSTRIQTAVEEGNIPEELKVVIFRIAQEALNNVAKHSKAERVDISLSKNGSGIELVVTDDGVGIDIEQTLRSNAARTLGLTSMRERAELAGGVFSIESTPGRGTTVRACWNSYHSGITS